MRVADFKGELATKQTGRQHRAEGLSATGEQYFKSLNNCPGCRERSWTVPLTIVHVMQVKGAKLVLVDVFGQVLTQQPRDEVTCIQCGRRIAASRSA